MKKFQKDAAVHAGSVTEVSRRELDKRQTRRYYGRQAPAEITTTRVHPLLQEWARQQGIKITDPRLELLSTTKAVLHNNSHWKKRA